MSIPRAKRDYSNPIKLFPGPEKYTPEDLFTIQKTTGIKIGNAKRLKESIDNNPGVGSYNLPQLLALNAPSYQISGKPTNLNKSVQNEPSPQSYNPDYKNLSIHNTSPRYSISKTFLADQKNLYPGPGNYDSQDYQTQGFTQNNNSLLKQRFPESPRITFETNKFVPGPGQYSNQVPFFKKKGPKCTFSKERRITSDIYHNKNPGPGNYDINESSLGERGGVIGGKSVDAFFNANKNQPGPGAYYLQLKSHSNAPKFPKTVRNSFFIGNTPGPQAYSPTNQSLQMQKSPSYSFGSNQRDNRMQSENPGPGNYDAQIQQPHIQKVHFSGRPNDYLSITKDQLLAPSPQNYNPKHDDHIFIAGVFDKATRNSSFTQPSSQPGPGAYNYTKKQKFKFAYCHSKRTNMVLTKTPGPGSYEQTALNAVDPSIKMIALKKTYKFM